MKRFLPLPLITRTARGAVLTAAALAVLAPQHAYAAAAPGDAFVTFESGQVRPVAMSPNGARLFAVNTPDNRLEMFTITDDGLSLAASIPVGLEPVAVAPRSDGEVWVVNHLSDSVSVVDVAAVPPRVIRTLLVGDEPRDIVFAGPGGQRAFITAAHRGQHLPFDPQLTTPGIGRADVWVFDAANLDDTLGGTPLTIITLFGDTPRALAVTPDGSTVVAAVFHSGNQTTTVSEGAVCDGGETAAECTLRDGVVVPGGLPGPDTNFEGSPRPETGLIVKFNPSTGAWEDELDRDWSSAVRFNLPDKDVFAIDANATPPVETDTFAGVGTVLFNMAVNPASGKVYVSNTEARNEVRFEGPGIFGGNTVRGHLHEARITVIDPLTDSVTPRHLNKHIDYAVAPSPPGVKERSLATPLGMAVTSDGTTLYVAAFGSSAIGVFDTAALENDTFVPDAFSQISIPGGGPSGLVLDEARGRLYALARFENSLSIVDTLANMEVDRVALHNPEPPAVTAGRPLLYDARRTSSNGEASCASCHVFADMDDLAWDLGNPDGSVIPNPNPNRAPDFEVAPEFHPMKGPMTTQTLRGLSGHGPMHWRGDRSGASAGGDALDEHAAFMAFNGAFEGLLGREGVLSDADMRAFTDFNLQVTLPPNPIRALDNSLTADQEAGRSFFTSGTTDADNACVPCHALDPARGFFGTDGFSADAVNFDNPAQYRTLKIPHLRNMYQKVGMFGMPAVSFIFPNDNQHMGDQIRGFGFLHDGSDDTILRHLRLGGDFFRPRFRFPGGDAQRRQVEQFLLAFDSNLAPIVGQQVTLTSDNAAAAIQRLELLMIGAAAGECALTVKGVVEGEERGWYLGGTEGKPTAMFFGDRKAEPALGDADLRAIAAVPGQALTYTCVPLGCGQRIGVDRDLDGALDGDEIERCSDPADPASVPSVCTGDCSDDFHVSVSELVRGVNIALGELPLSECRPFDPDLSDTVVVGELIKGVNAALKGCGC